MAASDTEVVNSALIKLGAEPISDLQDEVKAARFARVVYPRLRKEVITSHPWNFAYERRVLSASAAAPAFGYDYKYPIPADILRVFFINEQDYSSDWKVEGKFILTDLSSLKIEGVRDVTDTSKWTATFDEVMAFRIAWDLAYPLTQSIPLRDAMKKDYLDMLGQARSFDAQEGGKIAQIGADEWINARR